MKEQIITLTSNVFGVEVSQLMSHERNRKVWIARHATTYLLNKHLYMGPSEIGRFMGKDHGTAGRSIRKGEDLFFTSKSFRRMVSTVEKNLTI